MSAPIRLTEESRARLGPRSHAQELRAHAILDLPFVLVAVALVVVGLDEPVEAVDVLVFALAAAAM